MTIKEKLREMAQMDEINRLRMAQFAAQERKMQALSFLRALAGEASEAQRHADNQPYPYDAQHPCVLSAITMAELYSIAAYTYKILTGEEPG